MEKSTPKISIVIVQYNHSEKTIACLESVAKIEYPNFDMIVIDNASDLKHLKTVEYWIELNGATRYTLHATRENTGYAGGNNLGIKRAIAEEADYVLILNNDVQVKAEILDRLIETSLQHPEAGIIGPPLVEAEKAVYYVEHHWFRPQGFPVHMYPPGGLLRERWDYISGAAMLVRREVFERIGLLDERHFLYFEDSDFCARAKKAGFHMAVAKDLLGVHQASGSMDQIGKRMKIRYNVRNAHMFFAKHGPWWFRIIMPLWSLFLLIFGIGSMIIWPRRRPAAGGVVLGILDYLKGRTGKI